MIKAGIIGLGAMGKGHLDIQTRLEESGYPLRVVAVADADPGKFKNQESVLNIKTVGNREQDFSRFHCYSDIRGMLKNEELDMVTIALPTFLHREYACMALDLGAHVFCEKPMALNLAECEEMKRAAERNERLLMIGHVARFDGPYALLKQTVEDASLGELLSAYFFRGGEPPLHSHQGWQLDRKRGGGAHIDQHIHDVDMVQYLFGMPNAVLSQGMRVFEGGGYDRISTTYLYDHCRSIAANNDWCLKGIPFWCSFRVEFTGGIITLDVDGFRVLTHGGEDITPTIDRENPYYLETKYFADCIRNRTPNTKLLPEDSIRTMRLLFAEEQSCDAGGALIRL